MIMIITKFKFNLVTYIKKYLKVGRKNAFQETVDNQEVERTNSPRDFESDNTSGSSSSLFTDFISQESMDEVIGVEGNKLTESQPQTESTDKYNGVNKDDEQIEKETRDKSIKEKRENLEYAFRVFDSNKR